MFKIATWNVNSLRVRLPHVRSWIEAEQPDVFAMQETKMSDPEFPVDEFRGLGYHVAFAGQKTYNGVAVAAREPLQNLVTAFPAFDDLQRRVLYAEVGGISILNLYVPNGFAVGSEKYEYKLDWLSRLHAFAGDLLRQGRRLVLAGDFNIAPADIDVHDPELWRGKVLCSEPERAAFSRLLETGLTDCYREQSPDARGYSWWDYRAGSFRRNRGLRIDHILAGAGLAGLCRSCRVDPGPRGWERPSDHAPVVAEFDL